jgi:glycosyltransferase involved in cell wall biosynthesis
LPRAITSTLRALGHKDELLVLVDGGISSDILGLKNRDQRLKIFARPESTGLVSALNFLLDKSTGDFIARMDSDDVCLRGRFRRQLRFMRRHRLDFVFSNSILFGRRVKPFGYIPQVPIGLTSRASNLMLCLANPFVHSTMLAKKTAMDSLGGYSESQAEDYDLWLRAATQGYLIGRTPGFGVLYRVHDQQISSSSSSDLKLDLDPILSNSHRGLVSKLRMQGALGQGEDFQANAINSLASLNYVFRLIQSKPMQKLMKLGRNLISR